jgi:hypothetical protein
VHAYGAGLIVRAVQEVELAVEYLKTDLREAISTRLSVSMFEVTIRVLGGLLSVAHLKNDRDSPELVKTAVDLAGACSSFHT